MSRRAEQRNAGLARRMDARSRHNAMVAPVQFHSMKPWWEIRAERRAQQAAKERAQRPILLPIQKAKTVPGMLAASLMGAVAKRPAWLGGAAHA